MNGCKGFENDSFKQLIRDIDSFVKDVEIIQVIYENYIPRNYGTFRAIVVYKEPQTYMGPR